MKRYEYSDLKRSQLSIGYYRDMNGLNDPILDTLPNYHHFLYTGMLIDDIANGILPILGKDRYSINIEPQNSALEKIVAHGLAQEDHYSYDLKDSVHSYFEEVSKSLVCYGHCAFEIVDLLDPKTDRFVAFDLSFIQPMTVLQRENSWVQYIPKSIAERVGTQQYIPLKTERLLFFRLPESFQNGWMQMMASLVQLNEISPGFGPLSPPSHPSDHKNVPFDFNTHNKLREQAIAKLTSKIGWNMRQYPHDGRTEYYWFHRFLLFEKFKIEMRESILKTVNESLNYVNEKLSMQGKVVIKGLPALNDVLEAQNDLASGQRSAEEILKRFIFH